LIEVSRFGEDSGRLAIGFLEDVKDGLKMVGEYDGDFVGKCDERAVGNFVGNKVC